MKICRWLFLIVALLTPSTACWAEDKLPTERLDPLSPESQPAAPALKESCTDSACPRWMEVWGVVGFQGVAVGSRVAPNQQPYDPLGSLDLDLNVGLLPDKKLYLFGDSRFWLQGATPGVTNGRQGAFDFSKREYDMTVGAAWNYSGPLELRVLGYSYNNLNRGVSLVQPAGFLDGVGVENRYYFPDVDKYDVAKLDFLSLGYLPSKNLIGANGVVFKPGMFARVYRTYDLSILHSYLYGDGQYFAQSGFKPRLFDLDAGLAARPFERLPHLELRFGAENTVDLGGSSPDHSERARTLLYGGVHLLF